MATGAPLGSPLDHGMVRHAFLVLVLWSGSAAAFDPTRWVQVSGGAWEPSAIVLSELEDALKPAVSAASRNRGRIPQWGDYTFQYQGRTRVLSGKFVYVNAFCDHGHAHLDQEWVVVMDGGACFFSAKYDPEKKVVYDIEFNGVA